MKQEPFGRSISKSEADEMFKSSIKLKMDTLENIKDIFKGNAKALRFFGGKKGQFDIAYVFDRNNLQRLLERIKDDDNGGLIFFTGVRPKDEHDDDGRPTLIAFPYVYEKDASGDAKGISLKLSSLKVDGDGDGEEHPGNDQLNISSVKVRFEEGIPNKIPLDSILHLH